MYDKGTSRSFLVTSTQYCGLSTLQHSLTFKKMFPPSWMSVGLLATLASADFYVSLNGSDTAAGTAHTPFRSFERAQKAVRGVVNNTNDDVRVYVAPGTYYLDEPLLFTDVDSGQHGHKVIWEAQDMDRGVNISGGCVIPILLRLERRTCRTDDSAPALQSPTGLSLAMGSTRRPRHLDSGPAISSPIRNTPNELITLSIELGSPTTPRATG
jgi:hypothetical protein